MKVVGGKKYVHITAVNQLSDMEKKRVAQAYRIAIRNPYGVGMNIIAITKETIEFIHCPYWDLQYEPIIVGRVVVKDGKAEATDGALKGMRVFHKRYLFVNPDYFGFDVEDDKRRAAHLDSLNLDKKKIGNYLFWLNTLREYKLPECCI